GSPRTLSLGAAALTRSSVRNTLNSSPSFSRFNLPDCIWWRKSRAASFGDGPWTFGTSVATGCFWSLTRNGRIVEWIAPELRCSLLVKRTTADRVLGTIAFVDWKPLMEPTCARTVSPSTWRRDRPQP